MESKTDNATEAPSISDQLQGTRFYLGQVERTLKHIEQSATQAAKLRLSPTEEVSVAYWKGRATAAEGREMAAKHRALIAEAELKKLRK